MKKDIFHNPMFPFKTGEGPELIFLGVSTFDFYALHAPPVAQWFQHVKPPNPPQHPGNFKDVFGTTSSYAFKDVVLKYHTDDDWVEEFYKEVDILDQGTIKHDIDEWYAKLDKYRTDLPTWQQLDNMERHSPSPHTCCLPKMNGWTITTSP